MPRRQAAPPLVLLPGTLCDDRVFAPLLTALRQRLQPQPLDAEVIMSSAFDSMRGAAQHVLSAAPPSFALLGFSLGGILALEVALLAPERVLGLALLNVNAAPAPPETHAARREAVLQAQSIGHARYLQEQLWPIYVGPASQGDMALQDLLACMANDLGHDAFGPQTEAALTRRDYRPLLSRLTMPTVVVAGEQDTICPVAGQRAVAEAMPNAQFTSVAGAGHFALLEQQDAVAASVAAWFHTLSGNTPLSQRPCQEPSPTTVSGDDVSQMKDDAASHDAVSGDVHQVLQVERRDFTELVPTDRPQVQSMRGFDPIYTDIVDYIVRCTHKIWDERDVGLIYTHYTHNCVLYGVLGTMYDRESIVRETIQRIVELPDRRGMATSVIWRGNDVDGFYTSHMTHGTGRHTEYGIFGKPTGRTFVTRTIVDCMILENKIYREWVARDNMAQLVQLGIDPQSYAATLAQRKFEAGDAVVEIAENRRLLGQYPPEAEPDLSMAHTEVEAEVLRWLHHIYNKRMFGKIGEIYASNCQWHGPLMRELYGIGAVMQQTMRLVAMIPDCAFVPQHICSLPSEEGGTKIAVRWMMDGHHLGYGSLGPPTGHKLVVMGFTHLHLRDGKIVDEWVLYDELSMLVQLKLAALHKAA